MSDTTLLSQLRSLGDEGFPVCWRAADALEQQAAQIKAYKCSMVRLHHLLSANGWHPGRTDDDIIDILAAQIEALRADAERLRVGHERYETVRLLSVPQFQDAYVLNRRTGKPFDEIIDDLRPFMRPHDAALRQEQPAAIHASDCAMHNAPAYPAGPCDCGVSGGRT